MAREDFLLNLQIAASSLAPSVQTDGIRLSADRISQVLRNATIWLTPKAIEGFDPADFSGDLATDELADLSREVEAFRAVASQVPADRPAATDQVERALPHFQAILTRMMPFIDEFRIDSVLRRERFPDFVVDYVIRVGEGSTGDPAAWIQFVVKDEVAGKNLAPDLLGFIDIVKRAFRRANIELYPYLSLRTESEQRELEQVPRTREPDRRSVKRRPRRPHEPAQ